MAQAGQEGGAAEGTALKRALTTPLLYFFILGDVLGAGVYVLVGQVAADAGGAVWVPLVVALLLALLTAASYAELATKYPRAGGASHYATRAFGPFAGFVAGFCMLAAGIVSVAALARGFGGDYLSAFVTLPVGLVAVVFLALLALVNARGIKESTRANVVATVVEVGGLAVIVVLGAWLLLRGDGDVGRLTQLGTPEKGAAAAVLSGSVLAYYSFVGFETSVNVAEETRDPRRSYPRALFGALATAGAVYVLVGLAASAAVPTDRLAGSSGPLLEVVHEAGGVPPRLFSAIALVAVANGALLTGIMSSRLGLRHGEGRAAARGADQGAAGPTYAVGRDRGHHAAGDAPRAHRQRRHPGVHPGPPAAGRLPHGQHGGAGTAPGPGRDRPLPGPDGTAGAGHRLVPRPRDADRGPGVAARAGDRSGGHGAGRTHRDTAHRTDGPGPAGRRLRGQAKTRVETRPPSSRSGVPLDAWIETVVEGTRAALWREAPVGGSGVIRHEHLRLGDTFSDHEAEAEADEREGGGPGS